MKKKLFVVFLCAAMSMSLLAGCGGSSKSSYTDYTKEVEEEVEAQLTETISSSADEMVSDETFESLQNSYATLKDLYDTVSDFYLNTDQIPQNDDIESALSAAKEYLDIVGDLERGSITEDDADTLLQQMVEVAQNLQKLTEGMIAVGEANLEASTNAGCSDESFAALQEAYGYLSDEYNTVSDFYLYTDSIPQNDEVEAALASAEDYLGMVGNIQQDSITEADAETLMNSMLTVANGLADLAKALAK